MKRLGRTWVWVKIRYPNNWMVNTKLDKHLWSPRSSILTHIHILWIMIWWSLAANSWGWSGLIKPNLGWKVHKLILTVSNLTWGRCTKTDISGINHDINDISFHPKVEKDVSLDSVLDVAGTPRYPIPHLKKTFQECRHVLFFITISQRHHGIDDCYYRGFISKCQVGELL